MWTNIQGWRIEKFTKHENRPNIEIRRLDKAYKTAEIRMVRTRRENARSKNAKTCTPCIYYGSNQERKPQKGMVRGRGTVYGKNSDKIGNGKDRKEINGGKLLSRRRFTKAIEPKKKKKQKNTSSLGNSC